MDKRIVGLMSLFFFSFVLFVGMIVFKDQLSVLTRAKEETVPSVKESLIFAWPLTVKADGVDTSTINVFLRNNKGMPISNKKITLKTDFGLIKENNITSDADGKSTFILSSSVEGTGTIEVVADEAFVLEKKVTVLFKK